MNRLPEITDVLDARRVISAWVRETPLEYHRGLKKDRSLQKTPGSFREN